MSTTPQTPTALDVPACSEFSRQPIERWRWYVWTTMKWQEPRRWVATCWHEETHEAAEKLRQHVVGLGSDIVLVRETTTFTPNK